MLQPTKHPHGVHGLATVCDLCGDIGDLVATGLGALVACPDCFADIAPTNPHAVALSLRDDETQPVKLPARALDIVDICEPL